MQPQKKSLHFWMEGETHLFLNIIKDLYNQKDFLFMQISGYLGAALFPIKQVRHQL